jgi:hypothetical protein
LRRYVILGILSVATLVGALLTSAAAPFWAGFLSNLSAGFVAALLILLFIDRAAEQRRHQEQVRVAKQAALRFRRPIVGIASLTAEIIKAAAPGRIEGSTLNVGALCRPELLAHLDWIDLQGHPGTVAPGTWHTLLEEAIKHYSDQLLQALDTYAVHLGAEFIQAAETVSTHGYLLFLKNLARAQRESGSQQNANIHLFGTAPLRDSFYAELCKLATIVGQVLGQEVTVRTDFDREDVLPRTGSSRLRRLPANRIMIAGPDGLPTIRIVDHANDET